jgi:hypothetical protein
VCRFFGFTWFYSRRTLVTTHATPKTLGQLADEGAPIAEAFELVRQLAVRRGWIPIGYRRIPLSGGFVVTVNGTSDERTDDEGMTIPPFHASVWRNGWPGGIFTMFGGTLAAGIEDPLIDALRRAVDGGQVEEPVSAVPSKSTKETS